MRKGAELSPRLPSEKAAGLHEAAVEAAFKANKEEGESEGLHACEASKNSDHVGRAAALFLPDLCRRYGHLLCHP